MPRSPQDTAIVAQLLPQLLNRPREEMQRRVKSNRQGQLWHLDLSGQSLIALPPEVGQLSALQNLYLERNQLTHLPHELGQLTQLRRLYLYYNQLRLDRIVVDADGAFKMANVNDFPPSVPRLFPHVGTLHSGHPQMKLALFPQ